MKTSLHSPRAGDPGARAVTFLVYSASASIIALCLALSIEAFAQDDPYYQIGSATVEEVENPDTGLIRKQEKTIARIEQRIRKGRAELASRQRKSEEIAIGDAPLAIEAPRNIGKVAVIVDEVINIGRKIWPIVEKNKPVVKVAIDNGNALPKGVTGWEELEHWQAPRSRTYRVSYQNLFGMDVVNFTYQVIFTYGGSYQGKGRYLSFVAVVPQEIRVLWGFTLNVAAKIVDVTNAGTKDDPVASAHVQVDWSASSVIVEDRGSYGYYMRGDGYYTAL
jgi:hypothetical protein